MKFDGRCFYVSFCAVLLLVISTAAQNAVPAKSELLPRFRKPRADQSQGAILRGYSTEVENGKREYELESMINGHSRDVTIAPDGTVLEVEQQVEIGELPASVRGALQAEAGSGKIVKYSSLSPSAEDSGHGSDLGWLASTPKSKSARAANPYDIRNSYGGLPMNLRFWNRALVSVATVLVGVLSLWGSSAFDYHLIHKYEFGAAPGGREYFDYIKVDPAARRVYLSHGTEVLVVNADTGALEGKVSGLQLSHGVAVVP